MKRIVIAVLAVSIAAPALAQSDHYVRGYVRQDGTYVQPHMQTNPDGNPYNNYSTQGNVNPYTGQPGTVNPYAQPQQPGYNPYGSTANGRQN